MAWHHQFNGHELEQTLGDGEGQGSLAWYSPWDHKELDTTEQQSGELSICLVGTEEPGGLLSMGWHRVGHN